MAGEYYTTEETLKKLALTEDQLNNLVREARIREFRIDNQPKFKVAEIDELAAEINPSFGGTGDASATDATGESAIELLPIGSSDGASDVVSLDESGEQAPAPPTGKDTTDTVVTPAGVSVFDEDELAGLDADPMAKTQIASSVSDEMSLEGGGSGSGLLDLSRESDDTSLGGVLDEIYSGEETMPESKPPGAEGDEGEGFEEVDEPAVVSTRAIAVEVIDPLAGLYTGLMVAAAILLGLAGVVAASLTAGVLPGFIGTVSANIIFAWIGAVVIVVAGLGIGFVLGKRG